MPQRRVFTLTLVVFVVISLQVALYTDSAQSAIEHLRRHVGKILEVTRSQEIRLGLLWPEGAALDTATLNDMLWKALGVPVDNKITKFVCLRRPFVSTSQF